MKKKSAIDYVFNDKPVERAPAVMRDRQEMDYQMTPLSAEGEFSPKGEEIAASEAGMRLIIDTTPDAAIILDSHGTVLFANIAAEVLFGQKIKDIIGTDFGYPVVAEEREEIEVPARDGSLKTAEMRSVDIIWEAKKAFLISFRDITERKQMEVELREKTILAQTFMDALPAVAMLIKPRTRKIVALNKTAEEAGAQLGSTCFGSWPKYADACSFCRAPEVWRTGEPQTLETESIGRFWETHWVPVSEDLYLHYAFDITERKLAAVKIREIEERFRVLVENAPEGIFIQTQDKFAYVNKAALKMFGATAEQLHGQSVTTRFHPDYHTVTQERIRLLNEMWQEVPPMEQKYIKLDGTLFDVEVNAVPLLYNNQQGALVFFHDITERKRTDAILKKSELKYRELSIVDNLTGLFNSRHFHKQLQNEIERVNRYDYPLTLILFDIDNFKGFNDAYGHVEGDQILMRVGQVVTECLRKTDSAYRYGGEEFTIILPMTKKEGGFITAERIREKFKKEIYSPGAGTALHMTISIGVDQFRHKEDIKEYVHRVDQLMYQAKINGKDRTYVGS